MKNFEIAIVGAFIVGLILGSSLCSGILIREKNQQEITPEQLLMTNSPTVRYHGIEYKELYTNVHYAFYIFYNPNIVDIDFNDLLYLGQDKPFNSSQWRNIYIFNKVPKLEKILDYPNEGNSTNMENYLKEQKPLVIFVNSTTWGYGLGSTVCIFNKQKNKYDFYKKNNLTNYEWINNEDEEWRCLPQYNE